MATRWKWSIRSGAGCCGIWLSRNKRDLEVVGPEKLGAVSREPAVGDAEHEFRAHNPLDFDAVDHLLHARQHLTGKFQFAEAERAPFAGRARPAEEKADKLPQRIEPEAARHHR